MLKREEAHGCEEPWASPTSGGWRAERAAMVSPDRQGPLEAHQGVRSEDLWTLPRLPRPVDSYGSKKRFHSRPPSAWKSPLKLEIPTVAWKTHGVSHERPQALLLLAFTPEAGRKRNTQEPRQKEAIGLTPFQVSTETGEAHKRRFSPDAERLSPPSGMQRRPGISDIGTAT